jgi:GNAT superfamily N-acetyltransferase
MAATYKIRPGMPEDWSAILPLLEGVEGQELGQNDAARRRFDHIVQSHDHSLPVAIAGDRLVAYGWVRDYGPHLRSGARTARLHDVFVDPDHRRRGIGAALLMAIKTWAGDKGVRYLEWQASLSAVPFYERLGYTGDPCPQPSYPFFEIEFPIDDKG